MRILLCDDHVLLTEALASLLSSSGHEVLVAHTPHAALDLLERQHPEVCILDVCFPDGDGVDVLARVADRSPETRVLMLSGSRDPDTVKAAIDLGAHGYLCKDVGVVDVVRAVERVHDGQVVLDPLVAQMLARRPRNRPDDVEWLMGFLTGREREVLRRITLGQGTQEMADEMHVSRSTARTHVQNVLRKLGVHSRLEAVAAISRHRSGGQPTDENGRLRHPL